MNKKYHINNSYSEKTKSVFQHILCIIKKENQSRSIYVLIKFFFNYSYIKFCYKTKFKKLITIII